MNRYVNHILHKISTVIICKVWRLKCKRQFGFNSTHKFTNSKATRLISVSCFPWFTKYGRRQTDSQLPASAAFRRSNSPPQYSKRTEHTEKHSSQNLSSFRWTFWTTQCRNATFHHCASSFFCSHFVCHMKTSMWNILVNGVFQLLS